MGVANTRPCTENVLCCVVLWCGVEWGGVGWSGVEWGARRRSANFGVITDKGAVKSE